MKIGIIGIGNVGSVLGRRWAEGGHTVTFGSRNPSDPKTQATAKKLKCGLNSVAGAVADAEIVVLATPWKGTRDAVAVAGNLAGKVLLDCTNPMTPDLSGLEFGTTTSGGEMVAKQAVGAKVVKIFNTTGADNMANPIYGARRTTMLYAGDDAAAKKIAAQLASELGFDPVDVGPLSAARILEPFAVLWVTLAYPGKLGMDFALDIVHRDGR